jgi:hypothetical protein
MDDNVTGFCPSDFFKFRVQLLAVIHDGALEFATVCFGGGCRYGWYTEKKDGKQRHNKFDSIIVKLSTAVHRFQPIRTCLDNDPDYRHNLTD